MLHLFAVLSVAIPLIVIGGIAEFIACALGILDPWDFR